MHSEAGLVEDLEYTLHAKTLDGSAMGEWSAVGPLSAGRAFLGVLQVDSAATVDQLDLS